MKVAYIAGPFRAENNWEIWQNIQVAATLALSVWKIGAVALCPHMNTFCFQGAAPDSVWLEGDLELVRRCDAILTTPDWQRSTGAQAEVDLARALGKPVFQSYWVTKTPTLPADFLAWVDRP